MSWKKLTAAKKSYWLFCLLILMPWACQQKPSEKLTIATAANMQFAMKELRQVFTEETGIECEVILGSSGKLTAQIMEGAPFDVFVSADIKYPQALSNQGFSNHTPMVYGFGHLVLWTMAEGLTPSFELLSTNRIEHIALANPKTAPYGKAAEEVLKKYSLYEKIESKLVFGESISQTNQFITSGAAQIGFTAKSVVLSPAMLGKGKWLDVDTALYSPIAQGMIVLKNRDLFKNEAQQFYDFIISTRGKEILNRFGYTANQ